jgi:hypothetical protein
MGYLAQGMEGAKENPANELLELVRSLKAQVQFDIEAGKTPAYLCMKAEPATLSPITNTLASLPGLGTYFCRMRGWLNLSSIRKAL